MPSFSGSISRAAFSSRISFSILSELWASVQLCTSAFASVKSAVRVSFFSSERPVSVAM